MPRPAKIALLVTNDLCLLTAALWLAYSLRLNVAYLPTEPKAWVVFIGAPVVGVLTFYAAGIYRLVTRYMSHEGTTRMYIVTGVSVLLWVLVIQMTGIVGVPRSVVIIYGLLAAAFVRLSRHFAGMALRSLHLMPTRIDPRKKVLIYGAGAAGIQLVRSLQESSQYKPVAFIDDDASLRGQLIRGIRVHRALKIPSLIRKYDASEILIAMPSVSRKERAAVIRSLESYPLLVRTLPKLEDIASGRVQISDLRPIEVEDLLGRDPVTPDPTLMTRNIRGKNVLVTGAGGTIGSELTRQILRLQPAVLVLLEQSEAHLYEIESEIADALASMRSEARREGTPPPDTRIVAKLGSTLDSRLVDRLLAGHGIHTIFHAAAYKHVPIVELNPVLGVANNTFGTLIVAEAAAAHKVELMVLVSTDKAVRPTSVMGASKRLAEMILQAHANARGSRTTFTIVRFGNVLDSSGSVVRRFRKQIENGGPVTVTHPEMIRYFMSIPEAAQLVIQAGALADGGEVFVLDMGQAVKIDDLARTMIRLSGLEVRDDANPIGDIAIEYSGLRPGEKLYEELLIGANTIGTVHPRIMKNAEPFIPLPQLQKELALLRAAVESHDAEATREVLRRTVEGYIAIQQIGVEILAENVEEPTQATPTWH